jgi:hypothetical protein
MKRKGVSKQVMNQDKVKDTCDSCEHEIDVEIAQTIINGNLRWYKSYSCPFCGSTVEQDGEGYPPDEFRDKILESEGEWTLLLNTMNSEKARIMKVLRNTLNLSVAQVNQMLKQSPNSSITGTKIEMLWIKEKLNYADIQASVVKK